MIFLTSDNHFNHGNIIAYCNRPFTCAKQAREDMIVRWNHTVTPNDEVHVLGDFIMGLSETVGEILPRLNGRITLIRGNHDTRIKLEEYAKFPQKIDVRDMNVFNYDGFTVVETHYPITMESAVALTGVPENKIILVHGHTHDLDPFYNGEQFNASVDVTNFCPVPITTFVSYRRGGNYSKPS